MSEETPVATRVLLPFAVGLLAGGLRGLGSAWAAVAVTVAVVAVRALRRRPERTMPAAVGAGVALGALSAALAQLPPAADHLVRLVGPEVMAVEGSVVSSDQAGSRLALVVRAERVRSRRRAGQASGLLGVTIAHARRTWPAGSGIRVIGRLRRPRNFGNPGAYDLEAALARRGIGATMFLWDDERVEQIQAPARGAMRWIDEVRTALQQRITALTDEPVRGYLTAVLLGATQSLDRDTRMALTRTGLAHVVSVSGFHIAVAAGACFFVIRWLMLRIGTLALRFDVAKLAAVSGLLPVGAYATIAGGSVPAARAFLMYGVLVGALACDRPPDALRALAVAAVLLAVATPDIAADVSFELSFLSVIALVVVARMQRRRQTDTIDDGAVARSAPIPQKGLRWWRTFVVQPLHTSLAATVATAPLTAWHFQQVSLIAPLANLVTLPLLGPATLLPGLAALPLVGSLPALADDLLALAGRAAGLGLALAVWFARVPWAAVETPMPSLFELALCYALLGLCWYRTPNPTATATPGFPRRQIAIVIVALLAVGDGGYWLWERFGNATLRVTFLSVGQGDAAVVELPRGGVLVIDGGGFAGDFDPGERLIAPFLRSRKILHLDILALSHPQLDHYGGLAYLAEHFGPREFWSNGAQSPAPSFVRLVAALAAQGTRPLVLSAGTHRLLAGDVVLDVLHPTRFDDAIANDGSMVLRLTYGVTSVLFTGDIEHRAERELLARNAPIKSDVLKVPHHGSRTSSTSPWLAAVAPAIAVISSGADNRFGFPAPAVVRRLRDAGATVWNTAERGAIRVVSDGRRVRVEAARPSSAPKRFEFPTSLW